MAVNKPCGLADMRPRSPKVTTVIEDFEYRNEGDQTESDNNNNIEDNLEYPGDLPKSLVRPSS